MFSAWQQDSTSRSAHDSPADPAIKLPNRRSEGGPASLYQPRCGVRQVGLEIIKVTAISGGTTLTVERGALGTTAVDHAAGAALVLWAGSSLRPSNVLNVTRAQAGTIAATHADGASASTVVPLEDPTDSGAAAVLGRTLASWDQGTGEAVLRVSGSTVLNAFGIADDVCIVEDATAAGIVNHTLIRIDSEILLVTDVSGATVSVARAQALSMAAAHPDAATITVLVADMLVTDVASDATSLVLARTVNFPVSVPEYLAVGAEVVLVSAHSEGVLTVTRARGGTAAAVHSAGALVTRLRQTAIASFPAIAGDNSENETSVVVGDAAHAGIAAGVHVMVADELMLVDALSGDTMTVSRAQGGTTNANHAVGELVIVVSATVISGSGLGLATTSVTVSSVTNPVIAAGAFLRIDLEVVKVASVSGTTLTVQRAAGGTTAAAHAAGATVTLEKMTEVSTALATSDTSVVLISGGATALGVTAAGQFLTVGAEVMRVIAVSSDTLTVVRAEGGSAAAVHAVGARVALVEGSEIASGVSDSDTTLALAQDAALAGVTESSYVQVGAEIMQVTAVSGSSVTVTRAQGGTTAAAHSTGASVVAVRCTTFTVSYSAGPGDTILKVLSARAALIEAGSVLQLATEFVRVTAVSDDSSLTVQREQFNSTALSHLSETAVTKVLPPNVPLVLDITLRNPEAAQAAATPNIAVSGTWSASGALDADTTSLLYSRACGADGATLLSPKGACETTLAAATAETVLTAPTLRTRLLLGVTAAQGFVVVASADEADLAVGSLFQVDDEVPCRSVPPSHPPPPLLRRASCSRRRAPPWAPPLPPPPWASPRGCITCR